MSLEDDRKRLSDLRAARRDALLKALALMEVKDPPAWIKEEPDGSTS